MRRPPRLNLHSCEGVIALTKSASAPLFAAVEVDSTLVPADVVAHEVYAQLSTPLMWRFLQEVPGAKMSGPPPSSPA